MVHSTGWIGARCTIDPYACGHVPGQAISEHYKIFGIPRHIEERRALIHDAIVDFLFRETVFRKHPFEPAGIAFLRGFVAIVALAGLSLYSLNLLVAQPVVESVSLPIRTSVGSPQWLSWYVGKVHPKFGRPVLSDMAFIFGQMQYNWSVAVNDSGIPLFPGSFYPLPPGVTIGATLINMDGQNVSCPRTMIPPFEGRSYDIVNCTIEDTTQPPPLHIQLTVDYSGIEPSINMSDINFYTVQGSFALPDWATFIDLMMPSISAFPLIQGLHVQAFTSFGGRRVIKQSYKDVLGIGANYVEFSIYTHGNLLPDLQAAVQFPPTTSSLVLSQAVEFSDMVTQEDYRRYTLISGLASIGGVFTVVDGVFAMAFGFSIMAIISGSKVISPFGVVGLILRKQLRHAIRQQYPGLKAEIQAGGMGSFLHDTAIGLSVLRDDPDVEAGPPTGAAERRRRPTRAASQGDYLPDEKTGLAAEYQVEPYDPRPPEIEEVENVGWVQYPRPHFPESSSARLS
ncbi:hypothetical protein JAAARDRAFT_52232 [Jaapia argillacea MUCL 33604]|uniref:Uncharacterized protein n=1 Tax=Jaapia argillacea MUCL 33604 TaxID=933084 RepID=A0A067QNN6_9AGAM|nr:hypothetical protein JAAARDRAFT_52232 [Jaapia argillacea MUCL 33604]